MQPFMPFLSPLTPGLAFGIISIIIIVALWSVIIKGFALWHAARNTQKGWFIVMLVINTVGILEIIYLIWFRPKTSQADTPAVSSSREE